MTRIHLLLFPLLLTIAGNAPVQPMPVPALSAPTPVSVPTPAAADQSQRMQGALAKLIPLGKVMEMLAEKMPKWPIQEHPEVMSDMQLTCVRAHLREVDFHRSLSDRVDAYVRDNPSRIEDDIKLLEGSGGILYGRLIQMGIDAEATGKKPDVQKITSELKPEEVRDIFTLRSDARYRLLRELMGMSVTPDPNDGTESGKQIAKTFMVPMLLNAMSTCNVPMSIFQNYK